MEKVHYLNTFCVDVPLQWPDKSDRSNKSDQSDNPPKKGRTTVVRPNHRSLRLLVYSNVSSILSQMPPGLARPSSSVSSSSGPRVCPQLPSSSFLESPMMALMLNPITHSVRGAEYFFFIIL